MRKRIRRIFNKPAGPSEIPESAFGWNNQSLGTSGSVTCELCGTEHPKDPDGNYSVGRFLGLQFVERCCGRAIDVVYREFNEEFATQFLKEFAQDPTAPQFTIFLNVLKECLVQAKQKIKEIESTTDSCQVAVADIQDHKE